MHGDDKHAVTATRLLVEQRLRGLALRGAAVEQRVDVALAAHGDFLQTVDHDPPSVLHDAQLGGVVPVGCADREQVGGLFVVQFEEAALDGVVGVGLLQRLEDVVDGAGDDTRAVGFEVGSVVAGPLAAFHGKRLAGAGLAIGKDGAVEALKDLLDDGVDGLGIQAVLRRVGAKHLRDRA